MLGKGKKGRVVHKVAVRFLLVSRTCSSHRLSEIWRGKWSKFAWVPLGFSISRPSDFLWKCSEIGFQEDTTRQWITDTAGAAHQWDLLAASPCDVRRNLPYYEHEEVNSGLPKQMDLQVNGLNLSRTSTMFVRIIENYRKLMHWRCKTISFQMLGCHFFFKYGMLLCSSRKDRTWIIGKMILSYCLKVDIKTSHMEVYM